MAVLGIIFLAISQQFENYSRQNELQIAMVFVVCISFMILFIPAGTIQCRNILVSVAVISVGRLPINTSLCFEHVCTCNSHVINCTKLF